jgi:AraC-like DNA-binding protein
VAFTEVAGGRLRVTSGADRVAPARANRAPLNLLPAGEPAHLEGTAKYFKTLTLQINPPAFERATGVGLDVETLFRQRLMFEDARLERIAVLYATDCASDITSNQLYSDCLSVLLATALGLLKPPPAQSVRRGGLTPRQLQRVTEMMEARLAETVSLRELAAQANLSPSYLCRAFRASTGCAPHQWQTTARIRRAQQLLLDGDMPLAQIATVVGFTDQAHFTRVFSRTVSETPGAWRRARRGQAG